MRARRFLVGALLPQPPAYLLVVVDVFVGHAGEEAFEVVSLVALPALPVGLQVGVETLHFVLALLHLERHLRREQRALQLQGTLPYATGCSLRPGGGGGDGGGLKRRVALAIWDV